MSSAAPFPAAPHPVVLLERVRARDRAGAAGRPRGRLFGLHAALGPGVHAVLGTPEDGILALAELLSGHTAAVSGRVRIAGQDPARSPALRARIGVLPPAPELPDAPTVAAAVAMARRARGERGDAAPLLVPLGLAPLLGRRPGSLGFAEARAIELALALTQPAPILVVLFEPFANVAVPAPVVVGRRLRALADEGICVVFLTSSPADARAHAEAIHLLDRGVISHTILGGGDGLAAVPAGGEVELVAAVHEPEPPGAGVRGVAAALSRAPAVRAVAWEQASPGALSTLRVRASDRAAAALAVLDAVAAEGALLSSLSSVAPPLLRVRAAAAALAAGALGGPLHAPVAPSVGAPQGAGPVAAADPPLAAVAELAAVADVPIAPPGAADPPAEERGP